MSTEPADAGPAPNLVGPRPWTIAIRLAVATAIVTALLLRIDWAQIQDRASDLDRASVALAALCFVAIAGIEAARLKVAFPGISYLRCLRLQLVGGFVGAFLPGQLGSEIYKITTLKGLADGLGRAGSLLVLVRVTGLCVMAAAAVPAAIFFTPAFSASAIRPNLTKISVVVAVLVFLALTVVLFRRAFPTLSNRIDHEWVQAATAVRQVRPRQVAELILLSVLVLGLRGATLSLLAAATGFRIGWLESVAAGSLVALATILPLSIAGLGMREGAVVVLLTALGAGYEDAILVALLGRALMIALACIGGFIAWLTPTPVNPRRAGKPPRVV